jgi:peptidoglycan LD-endopeptidase CwlK
MASRDKKDLHPILVASYEKAAEEYAKLYPNSPQPFITCTYRSPEEQNKLFKQRPKVTNAKAGQSPHNYLPALAFDIAFITLKKELDWSASNFKKFWDILKKYDVRLEWGGSWKFSDKPHYQLLNWTAYKGKAFPTTL